METELDFVQALIKDIEDGSLEGIELWRAFSAAPRRAPPSSSAGIAGQPRPSGRWPSRGSQ